MSINLVATSHGTDVPAARTAITALVEAVREAAPHLDVHEAFVDVQLPRVDTAVDLVTGLAVVVPLLLAPGFHVHVDIQGAADRPWATAAPTLGPDDRLTATMCRRLVQAGATRDDVVVLGAAGSTDVGARASIDVAARLLGAAWGSPVEVGYVGGSGVPIAEVVQRAAATGRRVVIASYLVAPGFFFDGLGACGADVVTRPLLDGTTVEPDLVSLVLDRFAEAAGHLDWASASAPHPAPAHARR
ncbi:MAG: CbiX/SirB N-terminal domain-containing protein [Aeromicrobium sp.]